MTDPQPDFARFVADRQQSLLRLAMVLSGDSRLAEEVVADVLGRLYERWTTVGSLAHPYAYVRRMVVNEYLSWRRRARRTSLLADLDGLGPAEPDHSTGHAERDAVLAQLAELPKRQRATLVLRYYEGLTDAEIAEVFGCSESTVRSNAARGLSTLRITAAAVPASASKEI